MAFEKNAAVVHICDIDIKQAQFLLGCFSLQLCLVEDGLPIPGSYWGECEAGLIGSNVYVRCDTPVHSLLHEACHLIVLPTELRAKVHTDATDSIAEEDATCYLQLLLADSIDGFGFERACADMDLWGYTFRLGSARAWFESDAEDAHAFLQNAGLIDSNQHIPALIGLPNATQSTRLDI
jgi:hypothetical protein